MVEAGWGAPEGAIETGPAEEKTLLSRRSSMGGYYGGEGWPGRDQLGMRD